MKDVWHDPPMFPFKLGRAAVLFLEQGSEGLHYANETSEPHGSGLELKLGELCLPPAQEL